MDCLVTGGAGFIGSHLVNRLLADGHKVRVYDNLSAGSLENLANHKDDESMQIYHADIRDLCKLTGAMEGCDFVFHLAADPIIRGGFQRRVSPIENNILGTHNVLEAMISCDVEKIAFSSSSTIYGEADVVPTPEDYGPLEPISLYASSKLAGEALITAYSHGFDLKYWVFRFANIVGARMTHGVIHDFVKKLKTNPEELEILGDGKQKKAFMLAQDCVDAMDYCIRNSRNEVYNIGTPGILTIDDVADLVTKELGITELKYRHTGGRRGWKGDVPLTILDVSKLNRLGWTTRNDSDEAVSVTARLLEREGG